MEWPCCSMLNNSCTTPSDEWGTLAMYANSGVKPCFTMLAPLPSQIHIPLTPECDLVWTGLHRGRAVKMGYLDGLSSDWHLYQKGKQCSETWEVQDGGEGLEKDGWPPVWEATLQESVPQFTEGNQPASTLLGSQLWFPQAAAVHTAGSGRHGEWIDFRPFHSPQSSSKLH